MDNSRRLNAAFWALRFGLGVTAIVAGADKFTNLLANWEEYLAPKACKRLPVSKKAFMRAVGVVEMLVGVGILSPRSRLSSYAASAWLAAIAANLVLDHDYDIAARDLNMAISAFALAQLDAVHEQEVQDSNLVEDHLRAA